MKIPFVDLKTQYIHLKGEIDSAIAEVIAETAFVGGTSNRYVTKFEQEFATYLSLKNVVSCANGTDSLEILLEAIGIKEGDEVIVPALSWISTSEAVGRAGAVPVFIDVCEDTLLMDLDKVEQRITGKTKAIIPVHLYGNALNMEKVMKLAGKHGLSVIEDCAQSHGATYDGKMAGTFGHAASFSFYPGKNLGAYGDAGCIATNSDELAGKCRMIANHGQLEKHNHLMEGRNSRLDGIQAAILSSKLKHLNQWNDARVKHAQEFTAGIDRQKFTLPQVNSRSTSVYHLYVIRHPRRDELRNFLREKNIETAIHYPTPLPLLKAYSKYQHRSSDFPVADSATKKMLSIPMYPELTSEQTGYIVSTLNSF